MKYKKVPLQLHVAVTEILKNLSDISIKFAIKRGLILSAANFSDRSSMTSIPIPFWPYRIIHVKDYNKKNIQR